MDNELITIVGECYSEFLRRRALYKKMEDYYNGHTDAMRNYTKVKERANSKVNVNYIKKFIREEVSYSFGHPINYISKKGLHKSVDTIVNYVSKWREDHDIRVSTEMLKFGVCWEIYYTDTNNEKLLSRTVSPLNGIAYHNDEGEIEVFLHIFKREFDETLYIDIYTNDFIYHYKEGLLQVAEKTKNMFDCIPIGEARLCSPQETIYSEIADLEDAYITMLSDACNMISDTRNCYMTITGAEVDPDEINKLKEDAVLIVPQDARIGYLIKNVNDSYIQNSLNKIEDLMYELTSHINFNVNLASNVSGVALRSRLASLEMRATLNQKSYAEMLKKRIRVLFSFVNLKFGENLDYSDIKFKFTMNVPNDDKTYADIIAILGDRLTDATALSLLSFIDNPELEAKLAKKEHEEELMSSTLLGNNHNDNSEKLFSRGANNEGVPNQKNEENAGISYRLNNNTKNNSSYNATKSTRVYPKEK